MEAAFASLRSASAGLVDAQDAQAAATQGWLAILDLKARNRELYEGLETQRQRTAEAKAAMERTHLRLQNLEYEKAHYGKEVRNCREFKSAWSEEQIGLADEDDFLRRAPAELTRPAEQPELERHERMLHRLAFELAGASLLAAGCAAPHDVTPYVWRADVSRRGRAQGAGRAPQGAESAEEGFAGDNHKPQDDGPLTRYRAQSCEARLQPAGHHDSRLRQVARAAASAAAEARVHVAGHG